MLIETSTQPEKLSDSDNDSDKGDLSEVEEKPRRCAAKSNGLPPRKALKSLIMRELDKTAPMIFEELMKCKELG